MEGARDPLPSPPADDSARETARAAGLVAGWLRRSVIFVLDTLVKAAFISFWHIIFSVIRLQAGW